MDLKLETKVLFRRMNIEPEGVCTNVDDGREGNDIDIKPLMIAASNSMQN